MDFNTNNEVWKEINGYDGVYFVSNLGRVTSVDRINAKGARIKGKILKQYETSNGYLTVMLYKGSRKSAKSFYVHRLVAEHFITDKNSDVNHKDGNKRNNSIDNLEWATHSENIVHAYENMLVKKCRQVKITSPDGKETIMPNTAKCSRYFGFKKEWVRDRMKKHGNKFEYNGYLIEVS